MQKCTIVNSTIDELSKLYPDAHCTLEVKSPFELLIATILSAQATDKKVNEITPRLFSLYGTAELMAKADIKDIEEIIKPLGFYHTKAYNLIECSKKLVGKEVPRTIEELVKLNGVGRKTANLIVGEVYGEPAVVTDTHVIRISTRLGLTENKDPKKIEMDLKSIIEPKKQLMFCHLLVAFGRDICFARNPKCEVCPLTKYCNYIRENKGLAAP